MLLEAGNTVLMDADMSAIGAQVNDSPQFLHRSRFLGSGLHGLR
jgi:hypothetical protein